MDQIAWPLCESREPMSAKVARFKRVRHVEKERANVGAKVANNYQSLTGIGLYINAEIVSLSHTVGTR